MPRYADFVQLLDSLEDANPERGIRLISARFKESFHPYPDILGRVRRLASEFREQGLAPGQRVLVSLATDIDSICSFFALIYLGAVPFSIATPLIGQDRKAHLRKVEKFVDAYGIDRVLESKDLAGLAEAVGQTPLHLAPPPDDSPAIARGPRVVSPSDVAFVQFSSGSTASPKGVQITHGNLLYNMSVIVDNDRRSERSVMVSWLPLYHDMGLVGCLLTNLICKNDLVLMDPRCFLVRPISWLAAVSKWRGTVTAIPNFALDICNDRVPEEQLEKHSIDLSSFRYIYNGSEPVRVSAIHRFEEKYGRYGFVPGSIYPVYGMSETTLIISAPEYGKSVVSRKLEGMDVPSVGYPLGDFEIRIRDDDGSDLAVGRVGEIWLRGSSVTPGYLPPSVHKDLIRDGWLGTGDLGLLDEKGRLYISGRKKDLIIHQGRNFYGHDIAARLEELRRVRKGKVFVFGVDVDDEEKVVVMVVPPKSAAGESEEDRAEGLVELEIDIRKLVMREFGLAIDDVCFVPQIPKTTSGKIVRHRCRDIYLAELKQASAGGS